MSFVLNRTILSNQNPKIVIDFCYNCLIVFKMKKFYLDSLPFSKLFCQKIIYENIVQQSLNYFNKKM